MLGKDSDSVARAVTAMRERREVLFGAAFAGLGFIVVAGAALAWIKLSSSSWLGEDRKGVRETYVGSVLSVVVAFVAITSWSVYRIFTAIAQDSMLITGEVKLVTTSEGKGVDLHSLRPHAAEDADLATMG